MSGARAVLKEFKQFAMRGNVVDLAVGIILGAAFTTIVNSLVNDILMPPIGLLIGGIDFSNFFLTLKGSDYETLADAQKAGAVTINYGLFLNAIVRFLIVGFAVFILVKQVNRLRSTESPPPAPPSRQDELLTDIRDLLRQRTTP